MGCGSYSYNDAVTRSRSYKSQSIEKTFSKKNMDSEMNPLNINVRESCDSEEHPESFPIIIALDETGSMGRVPKYLIDLPDCVASITKAGIDNPHMCWYFATNHIKTDALEKRGIKGCLITISDEPIHKTLPKEAITHYIGDECSEDLATSFIYRECAKKWDSYYSVESISKHWKPYVGDNLIISDKEHVGESIARIVSNSYGQQTNS